MTAPSVKLPMSPPSTLIAADPAAILRYDAYGNLDTPHYPAIAALPNTSAKPPDEPIQ